MPETVTRSFVFDFMADLGKYNENNVFLVLSFCEENQPIIESSATDILFLDTERDCGDPEVPTDDFVFVCVFYHGGIRLHTFRMMI